MNTPRMSWPIRWTGGTVAQSHRHRDLHDALNRWERLQELNRPRPEDPRVLADQLQDPKIRHYIMVAIIDGLPSAREVVGHLDTHDSNGCPTYRKARNGVNPNQERITSAREALQTIDSAVPELPPHNTALLDAILYTWAGDTENALERTNDALDICPSLETAYDLLHYCHRKHTQTDTPDFTPTEPNPAPKPPSLT